MQPGQISTVKVGEESRKVNRAVECKVEDIDGLEDTRKYVEKSSVTGRKEKSKVVTEMLQPYMKEILMEMG